MLFESIYSQDFRIVGKIINTALEKKGLSSGEIKTIIERYSIGEANAESVYDNLIAKKSWPLLQKESECYNDRIKSKYTPTIKNKYQRQQVFSFSHIVKYANIPAENVPLSLLKVLSVKILCHFSSLPSSTMCQTPC